MPHEMSRRELILSGVAGGAPLIVPAAIGHERRREAERKMHLGMVTYNIARDWDLDSLLKNCKEAGLEGLEFRTTHAHGVEPSLDAAQRAEVKRKCADAGLRQLSMGSICEFHYDDPALVRQHIETCKEFVKLAVDLGARGVKVRPNGLPKDRSIPLEKTLEQIGKSLAE